MGSRSAAATAAAYGPTATRAFSYLTERAEDAQAAVIGIISGKGPNAVAGPSGADRYLGDVDLSGGEKGVAIARAKLESSAEHERLEGLRTVVAMLSKSLPAASRLFPSVLKLTSAPSLQVKTLVYLITLRLAPSHPDEALLSINSFQRDLSDHSPLIRGMALRVLSGLSVKMAAPLIQMAIAKSVRDPSFYVRRIAADAIGKCYDLSPAALPDLVPHLSALLADRHPSVLGSALLAYQSTVPDRYHLLHPHFRRICTALVDIDEWNQPTALKVLAAYARLNITAPTQEQAEKVLDSTSEKVIPGRSKWGQGLDKDFELLLAKAEPLLSSRNPAVLLSTAHFYLSLLPLPSPFHKALVPPILSLVRLHPSQSFLALLFIKTVHAVRPDLFAPHSRVFLPRSIVSGEPPFITVEKVDLLVDLSISQGSTESVKFALSELQEILLHRSESLVVGRAVKALGRLAQSTAVTDAGVMDKCTDVLLSVLKQYKRHQQQHADDASSAGAIASVPTIAHQAMSVLSQLITARSAADPSTGLVRGQMLHKLSQLLFKPDSSSSDAKLLLKSSFTDPKGRATIYWLLGQFCTCPIRVVDNSSAAAASNVETTRSLASTVLPDILRKSALHFTKESPEVKLAILTFSAKLLVTTGAEDDDDNSAQAITTIHAHLLQLARYDASFDVRDRARYYKSLTSGVVGGERQQDHDDDEDVATAGVRLRREQVAMVLFGPQEPEDESNTQQDSSSSPSTSAATAQDTACLLDPQVILPSSSGSASRQGGSTLTLPQWQTDASLLPPSSVRDAPAPVQAAAAAVVHPSSDFSASASKGLASASASAAGSPLTTRTSSPIPSAPAVTRQGKGKYRDLDAFLDESSESESSSEEEEEESEEEEEEEEDDDDDDDEEEEEEEEAEESDSSEEDELQPTTASSSIPRLSGEMTQNQWA